MKKANVAFIESMVDNCQSFNFPGTNTTVVCLTMKNGHTFTGESTCALTEDFDPQYGEQKAREDALSKAISAHNYHIKETEANDAHSSLGTLEDYIKRSGETEFLVKVEDFEDVEQDMYSIRNADEENEGQILVFTLQANRVKVTG